MMMAALIKLGVDYTCRTPVYVDLDKIGHTAIIGATNSGKTTETLYMLYQLLKLPCPVTLFIGDFKKSGDYKGITNNFAEYMEAVPLIDKFYKEFEETPEGSTEIKILLIDEFASLSIMLSQSDKKKADDIKNKIGTILMLGRSRHCFLWCVQQRLSAQFFLSGTGALDNFSVAIGLADLSPDSRKSLFSGHHFQDENFEKNFHPTTGEGICLIDGQPLTAIRVPYIRDKERMKIVLRKLAAGRHN